MMSDDVAFLSQLVRDSMEQQAEVAVSLPDYRETKIMEPLQVLQDDTDIMCSFSIFNFIFYNVMDRIAVIVTSIR